MAPRTEHGKVTTMTATHDGPASGYRVVGTRPVRPDGVDKVTGRAEYGVDARPIGTLYGKVLRSPHAHARIKRIDTSKVLWASMPWKATR